MGILLQLWAEMRPASEHHSCKLTCKEWSKSWNLGVGRWISTWQRSSLLISHWHSSKEGERRVCVLASRHKKIKTLLKLGWFSYIHLYSTSRSTRASFSWIKLQWLVLLQPRPWVCSNSERCGHLKVGMVASKKEMTSNMNATHFFGNPVTQLEKEQGYIEKQHGRHWGTTVCWEWFWQILKVAQGYQKVNTGGSVRTKGWTWWTAKQTNMEKGWEKEGWGGIRLKWPGYM